MKKRYLTYKSNYSDGDRSGPFSAVTSGEDYLIIHPNGKVAFTYEGGVAIKLINNTGDASVKGEIVRASVTLDNAFDSQEISEDHPIGIVFEDGVANGAECWVVVYGRAQVLIKDATTATRGYWVYVSDAAGRADATLADPPGGGIPELETHMREIGHCLESAEAGTDVLVYCVIHFN